MNTQNASPKIKIEHVTLSKSVYTPFYERVAYISTNTYTIMPDN